MIQPDELAQLWAPEAPRDPPKITEVCDFLREFPELFARHMALLYGEEDTATAAVDLYLKNDVPEVFQKWRNS